MSTVALRPDDWRRWRDRLTAVPHNLVLVRDGTDVGMVSLTGPGEDGPPELISLWVAPEARGSGAGDAAVDAGPSPDESAELHLVHDARVAPT